jgi:cyclic lactone autoinducer peptide
MKKESKKFSSLSSGSCMAALTLSLAVLDNPGSGCSLLFYEPKEPTNLKEINLKKLRKGLK